MDRKAMYKMINSKKAVMIGCGFVGSERERGYVLGIPKRLAPP